MKTVQVLFCVRLFNDNINCFEKQHTYQVPCLHNNFPLFLETFLKGWAKRCCSQKESTKRQVFFSVMLPLDTDVLKLLQMESWGNKRHNCPPKVLLPLPKFSWKDESWLVPFAKEAKRHCTNNIVTFCWGTSWPSRYGPWCHTFETYSWSTDNLCRGALLTRHWVKLQNSVFCQLPSNFSNILKIFSV